MPFELYSDVILTREIVERGLRSGDVGTVVERHTVPNMAEDGYSSGGYTPCQRTAHADGN